jgi:hypothetical protein
MNTYMKKWTLGATLPLALAAAAHAQTYSLPGGYNPLIGLPAILPTPVNNPLAGSITLPAPTLTPTVIAPSVKIDVPLLPVTLVPGLPAIRLVASKENAVNPLAAILPNGGKANLTAAVEPKKDEGKKADRLDELFDGKTKKGRVDLPADELGGTRPARRISLPEWDLEREIGAL